MQNTTTKHDLELQDSPRNPTLPLRLNRHLYVHDVIQRAVWLKAGIASTRSSSEREGSEESIAGTEAGYTYVQLCTSEILRH